MLEKQFLLNKDGTYPNGLNQQVISALGLIAVLPSPVPNVIPKYHYVEEIDPISIDGVYVQQWKITKYTDEEIAQIDKEFIPIINGEMNSNQV
jgi:hypothetical protein